MVELYFIIVVSKGCCFIRCVYIFEVLAFEGICIFDQVIGNVQSEGFKTDR